MNNQSQGMPWLVGVIVSIIVACIGAYATIEAGKYSRENSPQSTSSPISTSTPTPGLFSKRCIGVTHRFYQNITLHQNQPTISASVINSIVEGSTASFSKLRQGDMIIAINGELVTSISTLKEQTIRSESYINLRVLRPSSYSFNNNGYTIYPPYKEYNLQIAVKNDC